MLADRTNAPPAWQMTERMLGCVAAGLVVLLSALSLTSCGSHFEGPHYGLVTPQDIDISSIRVLDGRVTIPVTFRNDGNGPLNILAVQADCSCTAVEWSPSKEFLPGVEGRFTIVLNPGNSRVVRHAVNVRTNEQASDNAIMYRIGGSVKRDLRWYPQWLTLFIEGAREDRQTVQFESDTEDVHILSATALHERVMLEILRNSTSGKEALVVVAKPLGKAGRYTETVNIVTTSSSQPRISLPIAVKEVL